MGGLGGGSPNSTFENKNGTARFGLILCANCRDYSDEQIVKDILLFQARMTSENRKDNTAFQNFLLDWRDSLVDLENLSDYDRDLLNNITTTHQSVDAN